MIRIVIADDQDLIRSGLRAILEAEPDLEVVAEASDGSNAVEQAVEQAADVVLMDVEMPLCSGIEGVHRLMAARMLSGDSYPPRSRREGARCPCWW